MTAFATALLALTLAAPQSPAATLPTTAPLDGRWEGAISVMGTELAITVEAQIQAVDAALSAARSRSVRSRRRTHE